MVINPQNGVTFSDDSNQTKIYQEINSNQKYTGVGFLPGYD